MSSQSIATRSATGYRCLLTVTISQGLPGFDIVGAPGHVVRTARDDARERFASSGWHWPLQRVTVDVSGPEGYDACQLPALVTALAVLTEQPFTEPTPEENPHDNGL